MRIRTIAALLGCVLGAGCMSVAASQAVFALVEVAPGNYVHTGRHMGREDAGRDDIANIGFVVGEQCVAVVDTGGSVATGKALLQAIRGTTRLPVCYVINTHIHADHVLGNGAFVAERPVFVGHANLATEFAANRRFFRDNYGHLLGAEPNVDTLPGAELLVGDRVELDLGNRLVRVSAWQRAHSNSDLSVVDVQTGILWAGDLVFVERIPVLDGNLVAWDGLLARIAGGSGARLVPGHGPPAVDARRATIAQRDYFKTLVTEVRAAIATGASLEQTIRSAGYGQREHWLLFDEDHPRNVSRAYQELEWE